MNIKVLVLICSGLFSYITLGAVYEIFKLEQSQRDNESVCISKLIALEVERKDIIVGNGTCSRVDNRGSFAPFRAY